MTTYLTRSSVAGRQLEGRSYGAGLSIILVDAPPGHGPDLHRHPCEEVFVVQEGAATFTVEGSELDAGPGDVVVAPAATPHKFVNSGNGRLRLTAIHHSPEFVTEWLE